MEIYKIASLKPSDFADKPEILNKYFRFNNRELDRAHIPYDWTSALEVRRKVASDFGTLPDFIDLTDYIKDPRYYVRYNFIDNMYLVDEWYREAEEQPIPAPNMVSLNREVFDNLWHFCAAVVKVRKAMLFSKVLECVRLLNNIIESTDGFNHNVYQSQANAMRSYLEYFTKILRDKGVRECLPTYSDYELFGKDDATRSMYVRTYKELGQALTGVPQEELRSVQDIYGVLDPVLDAALDSVEVELVEKAVKKDFDKLVDEDDEEED